MATTSNNLLPNASFEFDFGDNVPTNWADTHNPLTIKLQATGQAAKVTPRSEPVGDAVDGERAARIETEENQTPNAATDCHRVRSLGRAVGHLTSPLVSVLPCTPHTISVYAKSDDPSAKLEIGLWTRPVDHTQIPDALSYPTPLSTDWQRYTFTCCTDELEDKAVVDLKVTTDNAGAVVLFDAAQLESGSQATDFKTWRTVEASVSGRRQRLIHLHDGPLELHLTTYNHAVEAANEPITLKITKRPPTESRWV